MSYGSTEQISSTRTIQQIIEETAQPKNRRNTGSLGKDDFLNLLVTQLKYQDPLKPLDDKEFIGQMAQFSSLEQMQNMNGSFSAVKALNMVGKYAKANFTDNRTLQTRIIEGEVSSMKMAAGKTYVMIGEFEIPVEQVLEITDKLSTLDTNLSVYSHLMGLDIAGAAFDPDTGDVVSVKGRVKALEKGMYEDYAVLDGVAVDIHAVNEGIASADPDYRRNYMEANLNKEVSVIITDGQSGKKAAVKGILRNYEISSSGRLTATLDDVRVSVDSIFKITSL